MVARSKSTSARSLAAALLIAACLSLPWREAASAGDSSAERISGEGEIARKALAGLGNGDGVILIAPGLQYYAPLGDQPWILSVVHVTPGKEPLSEAQFDGWKQAVPVPVVSPSFENGAISARAGNAGLLVSDPARMRVPAERCVVILDTEFFIPLYENEVRGGMIDLSVKLYRTLVDRGAARFPLYVIDPLSNPSVPLQWAYLGEFWTEIWRRPAAFRDGLPEKWRLRREAEVLAEFGQFEEAAERLDAARPYFPKDGSIDFQLARLSFWERETPEGIRFLVRAYRVDRRYLRGFGEFASWLVSKQRTGEADAVYRAGLALEKENPHLNQGLMRLLLERAASRAATDPEEAKADLREVMSLPGPEELKRRAQAALAKFGEPSGK
jgi:hypothetical protein